MLDFFTGRSNRQEYWISVALLIVVAAILNLLNMQMAGLAVTIMWIVTWVRRLHDVNLSGWWAALPIALLFVLVGCLIAFGGGDMNAMQRAIETGDESALTGNAASLLLGMVVLGAVIQLGFTIWLGVRAGTAGKNKYGEPPEPIFRR
jgi:uncharacterized membrane protein YhaH (DUF805 family)